MSLTPVPEELVAAEVLEEACTRVQLVADRMALTGVARIDTFMHAVSGDIVVVQVAPVVDYGPGSPIMQQVRAPPGLLTPRRAAACPHRAEWASKQYKSSLIFHVDSLRDSLTQANTVTSSGVYQV